MKTTTERRNKLLQTLRVQGRGDVEALGRMFGVSPMTIRRDIAYLEQNGGVRRVYGGVETAAADPLSQTWNQRITADQAQKQAIGLAATALIPEDAVIAVDGSSTAYFVARNLLDRRLTVITNGIEVLTVLGRRPNIKLYVTGGELRDEGDLVGPHARLFAESANVDCYIFGISGMDLRAGLTEPTIYDAEIKRTFLQQSRHNILVAASSKCGRRLAFRVGPLNQIHTVVTDSRIPPEFVMALERQGICVIVAPLDLAASLLESESVSQAQ